MNLTTPLIFLILAILCGVLGFGAGLSAAAALCCKVGYLTFLVLFLFTLLRPGRE